MRPHLPSLSGELASSGTEPPTIHTRWRFASAERNDWIGPSLSRSRAATLSVSFITMMAKYSGSAMMRAPVAAASSIRRPASCRFACTFGPEAIWIAATRNIDCVFDIVSRSASGVVVLVMIMWGIRGVGAYGFVAFTVAAESCVAAVFGGGADRRVTWGLSHDPVTWYS